MAYDYMEACHDLIVGIEEFTAIDEIILHPNPVNRIFHISAEGRSVSEVSLYSVAGQRVLAIGPINAGIDISTLRSGMYVVEVTCDDRKIRQKLIVQR